MRYFDIFFPVVLFRHNENVCSTGKCSFRSRPSQCLSLAQQVLPFDIRDIGMFNRHWRNGIISDHLLLHPVLRYYLSLSYQSPLASPKTYYFQQCNGHILLPCHHAHTETSSIDAEEQKKQIAMWIKPNRLSNPLD
jgi:hypothetical protein